eukprot:snap_masked-scaffold_5-processed-gene-18.31-mRNA-1 protein AED:0.00 eAED:0.00 QI:65/1/1/1/1/1/2/84/308
MHRYLSSAVPALRSIAPENYPMATARDINCLRTFILKYKPVVLTGAGLSTESGIPDYRSPNGSYSKGHKPATHQEFVGSALVRKRYWARSVFGFQYLSHAKPNPGHLSLAKLQKENKIDTIITQNVDRLHHHAADMHNFGSRVIELHGHGDGVECLNCGHKYSRKFYTEEVRRVNWDWIENVKHQAKSQLARADGDADLVADFETFEVLDCHNCHSPESIVMPTIVFFGGSVPKEVKDQAFSDIQAADGLLVVGSSVKVGSAFRLVHLAVSKGLPIGIVNVGETRADKFDVDLRLNCLAGDVLSRVTL